jgi:rhodanese-related sulfurtransferase
MKRVIGIISVVLIIIVGIIAFMQQNKELPGGRFMEVYASTPNAVLIDVRTPPEFVSGHIENAINIDFQDDSFPSEIQKLDPSKTYFVYCRSGSRSEQAISEMKASGIQNIYELRGGLISNTNGVQLVTTETIE